jgi:hypothetical protein
VSYREPPSTLRGYVAHDAHRFERDEPLRDELVDGGQLRRVDPGVAAEAHRATKDRRPRQVRFSRPPGDTWPSRRATAAARGRVRPMRDRERCGIRFNQIA